MYTPFLALMGRTVVEMPTSQLRYFHKLNRCSFARCDSMVIRFGAEQLSVETDGETKKWKVVFVGHVSFKLTYLILDLGILRIELSNLPYIPIVRGFLKPSPKGYI